MKLSVCGTIGLGCAIGVATLAAVALTGTGAAGVYLFQISFIAIFALWYGRHELFGPEEVAKARSDEARNTGSR